jgi:hypothetical protein
MLIENEPNNHHFYFSPLEAKDRIDFLVNSKGKELLSKFAPNNFL